MTNLKSLEGPRTVFPADAKKIGEYKWPRMMNLKTAAAYLGISYQALYNAGLPAQWERAGVMWSVPGTGIRRVDRHRLDEWIEGTGRGQNIDDIAV